jgi:hypothetical protein
MNHTIIEVEGLGEKSWQFQYDKGPAAALERQAVLLRQQMEQLKVECTHPEWLLRIETHKFDYGWGPSVTWTSTHCARCNAKIRSGDTTHEGGEDAKQVG